MKSPARVSMAIGVAVLLLVAVPTSPAFAELYGGVKGGAFIPNDKYEGLEDFDTGFGIEAFVGYRPNPNFGLEAGVGYYQSEWSETGPGFDGSATASAVPLTLTAKAFVPVSPTARLFVGAGVGAYFSEVEMELSAPDFGMRLSDSPTDTAFGYHAVAGAEYLFSPRWGLMAEAKWFRAEPEFTFDFAGEQLATDKIDVGGWLFSVGLLFQ